MINKDLFAQKILHFSVPIIFYTFLVYLYVHYNSPIYKYLGYPENFSYFRYTIGLFAVFLFRSFTPIRMDSFVNFVLAMFATFIIISMVSVYAARGYDESYLVSVILFFLIVSIISRKARIKIPERDSSSEIILLFLIFSTFFTIILIFSKGGFSKLSFDISQMYSLRSGASNLYFSGFEAYWNNWTMKLFTPALLAIGIIKRNIFFIALAVMAEILFFAAFAQKAPIAIILFILVSIFISRRRFPSYFLDVGLIVILAISIWAYHAGWIMPIALIMNRTLFAPAVNNVVYYEHFSENPFTYFSTSFLRGIIDYQYSNSIYDLISIAKTGGIGITPNTGVLGTGFMHMGYFGLLLYAIITGILLSFFESVGKSIAVWVKFALGAPPFFILLTSADLPVALVTNGLLLALLILFFWPASGKVQRG